MTNTMIIFTESVRLMEEGVLKGTGEFVKMARADGEEIEVEIPEEIHTFNGWKKRGFKVKKGEKSNIKFPIWKYTVKMLDTNTGNEENDKMNATINEQGGQSNMFVKMSAFFTREQVEPVTERAV